MGPAATRGMTFLRAVFVIASGAGLAVLMARPGFTPVGAAAPVQRQGACVRPSPQSTVRFSNGATLLADRSIRIDLKRWPDCQPAGFETIVFLDTARLLGGTIVGGPARQPRQLDAVNVRSRVSQPAPPGPYVELPEFPGLMLKTFDVRAGPGYGTGVATIEGLTYVLECDLRPRPLGAREGKVEGTCDYFDEVAGLGYRGTLALPSLGQLAIVIPGIRAKLSSLAGQASIP